MFLALALPALVVQSAGPEALDLLRFERRAVLDGEVWRLVTGHFAHLGWNHLALNLAGLALIAALWPNRPLSPGKLALLLLALPCVVSAGLLTGNPELEWYVGLSGALHGLAVFVAFEAWRAQWRPGLLLLAGVLAKVAAEQLQTTQPALNPLIGGRVIADAHLYGALAGIGISAVVRICPGTPLPCFVREEPAQE